VRAGQEAGSPSSTGASRCSASTPASSPAAAPQARRRGRGGSSAKTTCLSSGPVHRRERQVLRAARPARRRRQGRPAIDDGSDGGRDQRTGTSPILGRRSFPLVSTLNRALAVNRMACRRSCGTGTGAGRPSAPSVCRRRRRRSPVRGVQVRLGLLEHHGRYRTGPGPLRGGLGRGQPRRQRGPLGPAPAHRTPPPPRLTGPRHRPGRPALGHPCQVAGASVPVSRARTSPTVRSRPSGSGSGRCAWMW
jgi:hypothetical protein